MRRKGHKKACRCVGCSPATRKRGLKALRSAPRRRTRSNPRRRSTRGTWMLYVNTVEGWRAYGPYSTNTRAEKFARGLDAQEWETRNVDSEAPMPGVTHHSVDLSSKPKGFDYQDNPVTIRGRSYPDAVISRRFPDYGSGQVDDKELKRRLEILRRARGDRLRWDELQLLPRAEVERLHRDGKLSMTTWNEYNEPGSKAIEPHPFRRNPTPSDPCEVCGDPLRGFEQPCLECVKARHRGVVNRRCTCPARLKRPRQVSGQGRTWTACDRCLAPITPGRRRR